MSSEAENKSILAPRTHMEKLDNFLASKNFITDALDKVEQKTNVKKRYWALAILTFLSIYLVIGYGASLLCNVIGFVYPAYVSVKAIESKDKDDDTEWLMYWVVFAAFSVCEFFSDIFLSWFPFYFLAKCAFLLWCMAPGSYNGSSVIYFKFIRPVILKNEVTIDNAMNIVQGKARELADTAVKESKDIASSVAAEVVSSSLKKDD